MKSTDEDTEPLLRMSLEMLIQLYGERNKFILPVCFDLGVIYTFSDRLVEGENLYLRANIG